MTGTRRDDIAANLDEVSRRIDEACLAAGRDRRDITLIAITKTYPASDVDILASLGVTDVGENRHPESADKRAAVTAPLTWHFVGGLQTNKAAAVTAYADMIHSTDRAKLVRALSRGAEQAGRAVRCLVQVRLSDTEGRAGVEPPGARQLADEIAGCESLVLGGVMAVASLGVDPRPELERLALVAAQIRSDHPAATTISAGMSDDFAEAIAVGATHLRIGRSILGERPSLR